VAVVSRPNRSPWVGPWPRAPPPAETREEGNILVMPVVEETAVVVKRLVVKEELRLRFPPTEAPSEQEVAVRCQRATVKRVPPTKPDPTPNQFQKPQCEAPRHDTYNHCTV
jgi:hypothetical protein